MAQVYPMPSGPGKQLSNVQVIPALAWTGQETGPISALHVVALAGPANGTASSDTAVAAAAMARRMAGAPWDGAMGYPHQARRSFAGAERRRLLRRRTSVACFRRSG